MKSNTKWITESQIPEPKEIIETDDSLSVTTFIGQTSQGTAYVWKSDFQGAKNFLSAVNRRMEKNAKPAPPGLETRDIFHKYRQNQSHKARIQSRLLIFIENDFTIKLKRAPEVKQALKEALGEPPLEGFYLSLRELQGIVGAHEWRKKGVFVPALGERVFPHFGVFAPIRGEYLDLLNQAPISPHMKIAFDIGTGTGVIAAILARRGVPQIIATDSEPRAISCAQENSARLGLSSKIKTLNTSFFPEGKADLIVCNPPWLPGRPTSRLENAIYDSDNRMVKGFLSKAKNHLSAHGEVWLIISDLAEHFGLRDPQELKAWIEDAGLQIIDKIATKPNHPKSQDKTDELFFARSKEVTSLFRLKGV